MTSRFALITLVLVLTLCSARSAAAQDAAAQDTTPPSPRPSAIAAVRPTIAIAALDTDRTGWVPPPNFGETVADLLANRVVGLGAFRVFDRALFPDRGPNSRASFEAVRDAAAQAGIDYVVLGAVTRFGNEKKTSRGGLLGIPFLGGGGKSTQESTVGLTLRVVHVRTGEIVSTSTSLGAAGKSHRTIGGGALVHGLPVGGLFSSSSSGSLDRLVAEALVDAVEEAAAALTKAAERITTTRATAVAATAAIISRF
jgi:curli biogenesis system outer membrane secretion channel CsgG